MECRKFGIHGKGDSNVDAELSGPKGGAEGEIKVDSPDADVKKPKGSILECRSLVSMEKEIPMLMQNYQVQKVVLKEK